MDTPTQAENQEKLESFLSKLRIPKDRMKDYDWIIKNLHKQHRYHVYYTTIIKLLKKAREANES